MSRKSRSFLGLRFERLEDRRFMAGDVAAALSGQDLLIDGDNIGNEIRIVQVASGNVTVTGLNGTTINGLPSVTFINPNLIKSEIRMNDGADRVVISGVPGLAVTNDLNVELGAGDDILNAANTRIGANFSVKGESGIDRVTASNLQVGTDMNVDTGLDRGIVSISNSTIDGALGLVADAGNDTVTFSGLTVGGNVIVETKAGADRVTMNGISAFALEAATDEGADRVSLSSIATLEDLKVSTGVGNDVITLDQINAGKSVSVDAGDGTDSVAASAVAAAEDAIFIGGAGVDTLDNDGINAGKILEIKEFELLV